MWRRNPRDAPSTIADRIAVCTSGRGSESAIRVNVKAEIAETPAASPSSPSRKLTMFMIATIQSTDSGIPTHFGKTCAPRIGNVNRWTQMPNQTGIDAATT